MLDKVQQFSGSEVELEYLLTGEDDKETLMFVHGAGTNLRQFLPQHYFFSESYRVLSVSLRGHGHSSCSKTNHSSEYSITKNSHDLIELLDYLQIPVVYFIGNSAGGVIGLDLVQKHPSRIASLITFGTTAELKFSSFTSNLIVGVNRFMFKLNAKKYAYFLAKNSSMISEVQQVLVEQFLLSKNSSHYLQKNLGNYCYTETIETMKIPYLLIKGEKDKEINKNLDSTIRAIEKNPLATVIELNGAGHIANLDAPNEFNQIISNFIGTSRYIDNEN